MAPRGLHFGSESGCGSTRRVSWLLKRNCSMAPGPFFMCLGVLSVVSVGIALVCWYFGATLVLPFAGMELSALAVAAWVHARHATDSERIALEDGRLTVVHAHGRRTVQVEFEPAWVRVEPELGDRSLIELSGQGRRIAVGRFVRPELRRQLADELRWALRRWQSGPGPTVDAA